MNAIKYSLAVVFLLASLSISAQSDVSGGKETIIVETTFHCDHFKHCESGGPRLYQQLMDVPGIRKVKIDDKEATIEVTYSADKLDAKGVRNAINEAGFDADDQKAPEEAVAKLDACCRAG